MSFYDHFLDRGEWDSKLAALIFNAKDPRLWGKKIIFPADINAFSRVKPNTWQWKVLEYYAIFETATRAEWGKYVDKLSDDYL